MKCGTRLVVRKIERHDVVPEEKRDPTPTIIGKAEKPLKRNYTEELRAFVGLHGRYYLSRWRRMDNATGVRAILNWNWPAFMFSVGWFGFRKMFVPALVLAAILGCSAMTIVSQQISLAPCIALCTIYFSIGGMFGNHFYRKHADRRIERVRKMYSDERSLQSSLARIGGTSAVGAITLPILSLLVLLLIVLVSKIPQNPTGNSATHATTVPISAPQER
jgi:hypothetical protein